MNTWSQCLEIHAGGRREVLRRLVPELLRKRIHIQEFHFHWDKNQPSLRIYLPFQNTHIHRHHQVINTIENTLDTIMALYPWEEQPLLDWIGEFAPGRLSVILLPKPDIPQPPSNLPFEIAQQIYLLLEQDGTAIKASWIQTLHLAFRMHPELRIDRQTLFERTPESIRDRIFSKLAWLETNSTLPHEEPPLWEAIRNVLPSVEISNRQYLLQNTVNCLGFRPDEQAYMQLVATAIKQEIDGSPQ